MQKRVHAVVSPLTTEPSTAQGGMQYLLGYQLVQGSIAMNPLFEQYVGQPLELRRVEFTILQLLKEHPALTSTKLAHLLAIKTPSMTIWLDRLVARGLLLRQKSTGDGRATRLLLTEHGSALASQSLQAVLAAEAKALSHLSRAERLMLFELLAKVADARHSH